MTTNIGTIDRIARATIGFACIALIFTGPLVDTDWPRYALGVIGGILLLTAAYSTCPLYSVLGFNSCSNKKG